MADNVPFLEEAELRGYAVMGKERWLTLEAAARTLERLEEMRASGDLLGIGCHADAWVIGLCLGGEDTFFEGDTLTAAVDAAYEVFKKRKGAE